MDALVELLPLLFIAAYYLLRARRRAAQQREARRPAPQEALITETEERRLTPFQQFLNEVEDAMAEAAGERAVDQELEVKTTPPPSPLPAPPAKPVRPAAKPPEFRAPAGSFDAARPTDHERHGFGAANPLSEQSFEHRAPQSPRPRARPAYDPHDLKASRGTPSGRPANWHRRLADPAAAREAFVLQTIFGPRGGRAGDQR